MLDQVRALLIDLDGVLYVEDEPIAGAREAVERLRAAGLALRFVTNTTARSRSHTLEKLRRLGFAVGDEELVTPAALAVAHCARHALRRAALVMNEEVKRDFAALEEADDAQAVIVGDLGKAFGYDVLNRAFRQVMAGAELIACRRTATGCAPTACRSTWGRSSRRSSTRLGGRPTWSASRRAASSTRSCADSASVPMRAAMVGDDVESDIGGAMRAGLAGILVRTGKYPRRRRPGIRRRADHHGGLDRRRAVAAGR